MRVLRGDQSTVISVFIVAFVFWRVDCCGGT